MRRGNFPSTGVGQKAEEAAAKFLIEKGFKLLDQNYRCHLGEIDLIMHDQRTLVFVEVKSRSSNKFGPAALAVNPKKQMRIIRVAQRYIQEKGYKEQTQNIRFDVVGLDNFPDEPLIQHYQNAFQAIQ
jgi:putative endonuclease